MHELCSIEKPNLVGKEHCFEKLNMCSETGQKVAAALVGKILAMPKSDKDWDFRSPLVSLCLEMSRAAVCVVQSLTAVCVVVPIVLTLSRTAVFVGVS